MCPEPENDPPTRLESDSGFRVPPTVSADLRLPVIGMSCRHTTVFRAAVPEAPIYEDGYPSAGE